MSIDAERRRSHGGRDRFRAAEAEALLRQVSTAAQGCAARGLSVRARPATDGRISRPSPRVFPIEKNPDPFESGFFK